MSRCNWEMTLSDAAAQAAIANGALMMAGDVTGVIEVGEVLPVTERVGLSVTDVKAMCVIDAPAALIGVLCRTGNGSFMPLYSDLECETAQQAALAQMLNDAGEGFDVDDLLAIESLDAIVSVISVKQVTNYAD